MPAPRLTDHDDDGARAAALRYADAAEHAALEVPGLGPDTAATDVRRVGIIGAGTMGGGIAMSFADAGIPVTLVERDPDALDRGLAAVHANTERSVRRGSLTQAASDGRLAHIDGSTDRADLASVDLVVEAVFEDLDLKRSVFADLDRICAPHAVLATNTSALDVNRIAEVTSRPDRVIGMHFSSPAHIMRMLEVVRGEATSMPTIATAMRTGVRLGKVPVLVGVCHGFVGNRLLFMRGAEAERMLLEGATPAQVDGVLTDFGFPMGPFAMSDLAGLDVGWNAQRSSGSTLREVMCEHGRRGQKNGLGYYRYAPDEPRRAITDPEAEALIRSFAASRGITAREVSDAEVLERLLYPMVNEGAKVLAEGIARRGSDIDAIWLNGYAFPRHLGGPMYWADSVGLDHIVDRVRTYAAELGGRHWDLAPLLEELASTGGALHRWVIEQVADQ